MKILNIGHNYYVSGGSDRVLIETEKLLMEYGHEVIPFCAKSFKNEKNKYDIFFPKAIDLKNFSVKDIPSFFYNFDAKVKLEDLINYCGGNISIAHLHIYYGKLTPSILGVLKKNKIAVIQSLHEYKLACPVYTMENKSQVCHKCITGSRINCVLNKCKDDSYIKSAVMAFESFTSNLLGDKNKVDLFLSVSNFHRDIMIQAGIPSDKIKVLHNFVDTEMYSAKSSHDDYFLYFGRIEKLKGINTLIKAFSNSKHKLIIAGDGNYREQLKNSIHNLPNVEFVGFKSGDELNSLISLSKGVIVPSEWYENCPMNILEAKSMSRPVIGTKIGGIPELINHGKDGYLFECYDHLALESYLDLVDENFLKLSKNARADIELRFSKQAYYKKLMSYYNSLLGY